MQTSSFSPRAKAGVLPTAAISAATFARTAVAAACLLAAAAATSAVSAQTSAATLQPGIGLVDCESALRIGAASCDAASPVSRLELSWPAGAAYAASSAVASAAAARAAGPERAMPAGIATMTAGMLTLPAGMATMPSGIGAAPAGANEIDAFLAAHGKPTREAAAALLDPTDEHIAAMLRSEEQRIAVASYVAQRMTALRAQRPTGADDPALPGSALPSMVRMRATLWLAIGDRDGEATARELQRVAMAYPALDAQLRIGGIAGDSAARQAAIAAARIAPALPVASAQPQSGPPVLVLEDQRSGARVARHAAGLGRAAIVDAIVSLRTSPAVPAAATEDP